MQQDQNLKAKIKTVADNVRFYWNEPPRGKYMAFKEVVSYACGGIGAYFIISMAANLMVTTANMIVGGAIGIAPTDMYILYLISTLANIPMTGVRANIIDNTRGKGGKYRPYLLSMGLPTALIVIGYVWFPYEKLGLIFTGETFGKSSAYVATCAVVLVFNLLLYFFYNFFNDAYTNLIHVLSPNTQERTDVLAVKSVVYSLGPSIINIVLPIISQFATNNDLYDIRVYRIGYPIFAILGMALTIIVYANTQEKIVQAKTHTNQIGFWDSLKEVAKNKYFWIISLAGWLGFLESSYSSVLGWSYSYGHACNGSTYALINTLTGNAALWGMLLAPFCIRKWGKKRVLIAVNTLNVLCILAMGLNMQSIWWLFICVYFNGMVSAFEQITTPAIQADIRDFQQYKSGERIDGMFAAVLTIGNLVTLVTSSVLPAVQKHFGVYEGNGYDSPYDILDVTTGEPGLLYKMMLALIIMAAAGAFLNMVPYLFYDFTEKKQKSVIRVLQVRSLFEDYGNNALDNHQIVEAIDMVREAQEMSEAQPKVIDKQAFKKDKKDVKAQKTAAVNAFKSRANSLSKEQYKEQLAQLKKEYKEKYKNVKKSFKDDVNFNEEIDIAKFVCDELDKFNSPLFKYEIDVYQKIYDGGIEALVSTDMSALRTELENAKNMPQSDENEKEIRKFAVQLAKKKISAKKAFAKYYGTLKDFVEPEMADLTALFDEEDKTEAQIFDLAKDKTAAKKAGNKEQYNAVQEKIKAVNKQLKKIRAQVKAKMDEFAQFNKSAKPFIDARKLLLQKENYSHFEEIAALYDEAKINAEAEDREKEELAALKRREQEEELAARRAQKARKKKK